jgi:hypothetical protein
MTEIPASAVNDSASVSSEHGHAILVFSLAMSPSLAMCAIAVCNADPRIRSKKQKGACSELRRFARGPVEGKDKPRTRSCAADDRPTGLPNIPQPI